MTNDFLNDLRHFTGTEVWHRHGLNRDVLYTDGAEYVAEKGELTGCWTRSPWRSCCRS